MTEINRSYGESLTATYQSAMYNLICKAREESAVFPIEVAVTNANGESWSAVITIKDGSQFDVKHRASDPRGISLVFPLRMVAADATGDQVATMVVLLPEWRN